MLQAIIQNHDPLDKFLAPFAMPFRIFPHIGSSGFMGRRCRSLCVAGIWLARAVLSAQIGTRAPVLCHDHSNNRHCCGIKQDPSHHSTPSVSTASAISSSVGWV
jgi:hypothetical protein